MGSLMGMVAADGRTGIRRGGAGRVRCVMGCKVRCVSGCKVRCVMGSLGCGVRRQADRTGCAPGQRREREREIEREGERASEQDSE